MVTQPATAAGVRLVQGHIAAASGEAAHPSSSTLSASSSLVRSASVSTSARIPSSVSKMAFCCSETVFKTSSSEEKLMSELIGPARGHAQAVTRTKTMDQQTSAAEGEIRVTKVRSGHICVRN
mgnify:CR=1 FL=1